MIASGSLTPDIDAATFGLPAGTALRYERPADDLRPLLPSYAVLDSDTAVWKGPNSWILPGWPQMWIVLTSGTITVSLRKRRATPLGTAMAFGGTSCAMPVTSHGGVTVVVDVSPMGWARLFTAPAGSACDQVLPLGPLLARDWSGELIGLLHVSDRAGQVKGLLDDFFLRHLPPPGRDEATIARIHAAILDATPAGSGEIASELGMTPRALLQLCNRYFGYGPTVLKRRTRFLRTLMAMMTAPGPIDFSVPPPGYYDPTHFIRDGNHFLGLTPRRFMALPMPYLRAVLRARIAVLGEPLPLLDRLDGG